MRTIRICLPVILCALCAQLSLAAPAAKIPVILDTDIGDDIDDTWALTLALKSPELDLKLVVGDYGKPLYRAKLIAKLLGNAKRTDVAVGLGVDVEAGQKMRQEKWIEGYNLDRYPGKVHRDGVQAMLDLIMGSPEPVTLICIGPLPNIAEALRREPKIAERARFVGMHGSVRVGYNGAPKPSAEWNVRADAKACRAAFTAPWNMTITPLDTCGLVQLKGVKYAAVRDCPDPMIKALVENYQIWDQWNQAGNQKYVPKADTASSVLFDCVAVYLAMASDHCVMEKVPLRVDDQGYTREDPTGKVVNAAVSWKDLSAFEDWLVKRLTGSGPKPEAKRDRSLLERIRGRSFPSVFQAWSRVENVGAEPELVSAARHDLAWHSPNYFGLVWNNRHVGLADGFTPESIASAQEKRRQLLELNPHLVLLAEIRYRDAGKKYLPDSHPWWLLDANGRKIVGYEESGLLCLDFHNPELRRQVARQAKAVVDSGVADGIMLDWWQEEPSRVALIKEIRAAIGGQALIIANANDRIMPLTAPFINGYFMECTKTKTAENWRKIANTLAWAETHLREPRVNCLETWFHESRNDLHLMRATTALALTHSDGYCLFSDPNPLPAPDHLHNWYPFWNKALGKPSAKGAEQADGTQRREFENGTVVYNPMGNGPVSVAFLDDRLRASTGQKGRQHELGSPDGDLFLK